jgi:hypothetical protein
MITVRFTATVVNPDTEETLSGWIDPAWHRYKLRERPEQVSAYKFPTRYDALKFAELNIGYFDETAREDNSLGTFYSLDSETNMETGESWSYAAHLEGEDETIRDLDTDDWGIVIERSEEGIVNVKVRDDSTGDYMEARVLVAQLREALDRAEGKMK